MYADDSKMYLSQEITGLEVDSIWVEMIKASSNLFKVSEVKVLSSSVSSLVRQLLQQIIGTGKLNV